jgi:Cu-Zn family superoxide dismutase
LLAAGVGLIVALIVLMAFSASRGGADEPPEIFFSLPIETCSPPFGTPPNGCYPEGIAADDDSGTFYVSNFSTGSISSGNVKSNDPLEEFLPGGEDGRTQAIGLKLDDEGRLYIAGGFTGKVFIYDTASKELVRSFDAQGAGFLNDLAINPQTDDVYITDSFVPTLWRISEGRLEKWLDLTQTPIRYIPNEFNLNGIVATPDDRFLLTIQSNTGKLYRINIEDEEVSKVNVAGPKLTNGDGLVLTGNTLYVIRNQGLVTKVSLDEEFTSGRVEGNTSVPIPEDFPTTGALVGGRLLVVNSQFAEGGPGQVLVPPEDPEPEIPFTVTSMPAP